MHLKTLWPLQYIKYNVGYWLFLFARITFKWDYPQLQTNSKTDLFNFGSASDLVQVNSTEKRKKRRNPMDILIMYIWASVHLNLTNKCLSCSWNGLKCPLFGLAYLQSCHFMYLLFWCRLSCWNDICDLVRVSFGCRGFSM